MSYKIEEFVPRIKAGNYDKDGDGYINSDNGELQELLSGAMVDNIDKVLIKNVKQKDYIGAGVLSALMVSLGLSGIVMDKLSPLSPERIADFKAVALSLETRKVLIEKIKNMKLNNVERKSVGLLDAKALADSLAKTLADARVVAEKPAQAKVLKVLSDMRIGKYQLMGLCFAAAAAIGSYFVLRKPE